MPLLDASIDTLADESDPKIIGPGEVATVYDVMGLLSKTTGQASFTLADGSTLAAKFTGGFAAPSSTMAANEAELATCDACWQADAPVSRAQRVRISATGDVGAGGLSLSSTVARRIRWDLTVVDP